MLFILYFSAGVATVSNPFKPKPCGKPAPSRSSSNTPKWPSMSFSQTSTSVRGGQSEIQDVSSRREAPSTDGPSSNQNASSSLSRKDQTNEDAVAVSIWASTVPSCNCWSQVCSKCWGCRHSAANLYTIYRKPVYILLLILSWSNACAFVTFAWSYVNRESFQSDSTCICLLLALNISGWQQ